MDELVKNGLVFELGGGLLVDTAGNNTVTNNGATLTADHNGRADRAWAFDGIDDYLNVSSFNVTTGLTVLVPAKHISGNLGIFVAKFAGGTANIRSWQINNNSGQLTVVVSADGGGTNVKVYRSTSTNVVTTNWRMYGFTFSSDTLKLYVDGVEITNITKVINGTVNSIFNSTIPITIGCNLIDATLTPTNFIKADIQKPLIFNRALTESEIKKLYNHWRSH